MGKSNNVSYLHDCDLAMRADQPNNTYFDFLPKTYAGISSILKYN